MGVTEEGGKVAVGIVGALAGVPTLLVMVILNISLIGASAWYLHERDNDAARMVTSVIERCFPPYPKSGHTP